MPSEDVKTTVAADRGTARTAPRPRWRRPNVVAYELEAVTETRTCGSGSDSFPGWCASIS